MEENIDIELLARVTVRECYEKKEGVHAHPFLYADMMKGVV